MMRPRLFFLAALLATSTITAHASQVKPGRATAEHVFPYPTAIETLDNGLRVVVIQTDSPGWFALYGLVGAGSRDEVEPGHSGFAHFFEHIMFKGTKTWPADKRTALLSGLGVDESGYTTDDYTAYSMQGPTTALQRIVELEGDRYQRLDYGEDDFKTESRAVLGEYNKNFSDPDNKAYERLCDLAFDKHTYKHTTMGFLKDIEAMPNEYAYSRKFFQRFYTPDDVVLVFVGDVRKDDVVGLVRQHFGAWHGKRAKVDLKDEPLLKAERRAHVEWDNPTLPRVHVAWRVPSSVRDPKGAALAMVLSGYLFSESSKLHERLVLNEQLVEDMSSWYEPHKDATLFPVVLRLKEGKRPDDVIGRVQSAVDEVAAGTIDAARLAAVKDHLRYSLLMRLTSADKIAGTFVNSMGPSLDPTAIDTLYAEVKAATPADLAAFTKQHFGADRRAIVTLATKGGAQ
jgi:zinc protease